MKTKIKAMLLALTITLSSMPFSGITANAVDYTPYVLKSDYYTQEIDWDLWDRFIKYDLCITDYDSLTDEEKELCEFIFETERSAEFTIRCERARRTLAGDIINENRITVEEAENSATHLIPHKAGNFTMNLCFFNYVPDIIYLDSEMNGYEYWLDNEGTERITRVYGMNAYVYVKWGDSEANYELPDEQYLFFRKLEFNEASSENLIEFYGNYYIINSDNTASLLRNNTSHPGDLSPDPIEKTITIPAEINGYPVTRIESCAFLYSGVTKVVLPETITYIGDRAFEGSINLSAINIPESVEYLGEAAFAGCSGLTEITINCPQLNLRKCTFFSSGLTNADINVKSIGERAFESSPLTLLTLYEGLESIGANAFNGCHSLKEFEMPSTVKYIGQGAFMARELASITIPKNAEIIGTYLERYGSSMTSVAGEIPSNDPLTEEPMCALLAETTINGYYNTEAHRYAVEWRLKFNPLDEDIAYGDINLDRKISVADAVLLQSYIAGKEVSIGFEADLAKDGIIDIFDMIEMRSKLIGNS